MSKFNNKVSVKSSSSKCVESYEGGVVYEKSLEDEWINFLFSSLLQPGFYRSAEDHERRYVELTQQMIEKYGPEFVGKAAIFSRNELGMRSISQLTAALLNDCMWGGKRTFYSQYFHRPDDVGEVFGAVDKLNGKRSHALVRGAADYLKSLNAYQIGKYPMRKHEYNMHDIINITHAKSEVLDKYQKGILESPDTWEVKIHSAKTEEERQSEWKRLVEEKRLGYLALLRNLRNILSCDFITVEWVEEHLIPQIVCEAAIKKSLVWPVQIYTALRILDHAGAASLIEDALSQAFMLSISNMPYFSGSTLIVFDVSASMNAPFSQNSVLSIVEVCAVYAAAFLLSDFSKNVEVIKFGSTAAKFDPIKLIEMRPFKLIELLSRNDDLGHGTYIGSVLNIIENSPKRYDRILLFSDMQIMDSYYITSIEKDRWADYSQANKNSALYSFDLGHYTTQIVPSEEYGDNDSITYITALNDIVFKIILLKETKGKSLIDIIREYEIV